MGEAELPAMDLKPVNASSAPAVERKIEMALWYNFQYINMRLLILYLENVYGCSYHHENQVPTSLSLI